MRSLGRLVLVLATLLWSSSCKHYSPVTEKGSILTPELLADRPVYFLSQAPTGARGWQVLDRTFSADSMHCDLKDISNATASYLWYLPGQEAKRYHRKAIFIHLPYDWLPQKHASASISLKEVKQVVKLEPNEGMVVLRSFTVIAAISLAIYLIWAK